VTRVRRRTIAGEQPRLDHPQIATALKHLADLYYVQGHGSPDGRGVRRPLLRRHHDVDSDLNADLSFSDEARPDDLVCVLDYFGRPAERALVRAVRATGATVLEDATQFWMSEGVMRKRSV
jgi:hypothetical protein